MSRLALFLLGPPRIECDGVPIEVETRKAVALITYLATTGETHTRDALATLLWPEFDQSRARTSLRWTLWALKKAIGKGWLEITRESVGLKQSPGLWLDLDHLHVQLAECRRHGHGEAEVCPVCLRPLGQAVELYRDDFLAGFTLRDSPGFDEWHLFQGELLRRELVSALKRLVHGHSARGEFEPAVRYARRWLEVDPLDEAAHRQLMQLLTWAGHRAAALRQYEECVQLLEQELGVAPEEETTRLYQAIQEGQGPPPPAVPPPRPLLAHRHNLPFQPTPFIGREEELSRIDAALEDPACRLLTLAGPGGIGKTRLALQAAAAKIEQFRHGTYFIPLASLSSPDSLAPTIASTLQVPLYGRQDPQVRLLNYLREKEMLLVVDNFEHLLEEVNLLVEILRSAPEVKLLVTSRERLNLSWEWLLDVQGLDYPDNGATDGIEGYSAVQLFLQGARRADLGFSLSKTESPFLARICRLVEGVPLAIELAAAWTRVHSCREIAREIERNLGFLSTSLRDVPERHRSLRAVFEHSWDLLSQEEKEVFQKLAVFHGGFSPEAATKIAAASPATLSALVAKSLLRQTPAGRYQILEVVRQYAEEKLEEKGEEKRGTKTLHCAYYAAFLDQREKDLKGERQQQALEEIDEEIANVRAGWSWAVERGKVEEIGRALESFFYFYRIRTLHQEGKEILSRAVAAVRRTVGTKDELGEERGIILGKLLARQAGFLTRLSLYEQSEVLLQESLSLLRHFDARPELASALCEMGWVCFCQGKYAQARRRLQESLSLCQEIGDRWTLAYCLNSLGATTYMRGEYAEARRLYQESLALVRELGAHDQAASCLSNLGIILNELGEPAEAKQLFQESLAVCREINNLSGVATALANLGVNARRQGGHAEARRLYQESLALFREIGDRRAAAFCLGNLGAVADALEDYAEAKDFYQASLAIFSEIGDRTGIAFSLTGLGSAHRALGEYAKARGYLLEAFEVAMEIQAVLVGLNVLVEVASLLVKEGEEEHAVELLALVLHHPKSNQDAKDNANRLLSEVESRLPPQVMAQALERGKSRELEEVAEDLLAEA